VLFPGGWEEREYEGELELAVYGGPDEEELLHRALGTVGSSAVTPDWNDRWRSFHQPVRVGPLWVGPPWEQAPTGAIAVVVDPGQAFGTGAHPTTRLCLELLLEQPVGAILDLGCGSGVLAIAAAKLGMAPVIAVDHDPAAVEVARANARRNGVELDIRLADLSSEELPAAGLGLANLELASIPTVANRFGGRRLIASGYLAGEAAVAPGWTRILAREREGWTAELFERQA
jgi:ribosomal protein L11 methyltransferase